MITVGDLYYPLSTALGKTMCRQHYIVNLKPLLVIITDGKNCKTCDRIMSILELKAVELEDAGIRTVRINDRKVAKSFGILSAPGLTYFKGGKGDNFEGEMTDPEELMDFFKSVALINGI